MKAILIFFHCHSNTGYAIAGYERTFFKMASELLPRDRIHYAFTDLDRGMPEALPSDFTNVIAFDPGTRDKDELARVAQYIRDNEIDFALGVDQPVGRRPSYRVMRRAGVRKIVTYWGAPMSSINTGLKLFLKKIDVARYLASPDHFIFESQAMANSATHGRGVPASKVSLVYPSVDTEKYNPDRGSEEILRGDIGIPRERKVVFYSGHMEERKGVHVLVRAAIELVDNRNREDFHLLVLGNKPGEEQRFLDMLEGTRAAEYVTFGGYRTDLPDLLPHCYMGAIASTGWDSFPISALEMAASGIPVCVSDLQGLPETIADGETGYVFPPGDHGALADRIQQLLDDREHRDALASRARKRIVDLFTPSRRHDELVQICRQVSRSS